MRRVLVVDDEHLVADTLGWIFLKNGFDVRTVYTADQALSCALEFRPDLLLCDINMPDKDGIQLMTEITRDLPACRILVLTGSFSNLHRVHDTQKALRTNISILTKPCQPLDLLRTAGDMLAA